MVDPVALGSELRALTVKEKSSMGCTASAELLGNKQYAAQVWMQKTEPCCLVLIGVTCLLIVRQLYSLAHVLWTKRGTCCVLFHMLLQMVHQYDKEN